MTSKTHVKFEGEEFLNDCTCHYEIKIQNNKKMLRMPNKVINIIIHTTHSHEPLAAKRRDSLRLRHDNIALDASPEQN